MPVEKEVTTVTTTEKPLVVEIPAEKVTETETTTYVQKPDPKTVLSNP